jgi:hypothetical protein
MAKHLVAVVPRLEDTYFGKKLLTDPKARADHDKIVGELREIARPEIEAMKRSERLTWEDLHVPTFY